MVAWAREREDFWYLCDDEGTFVATVDREGDGWHATNLAEAPPRDGYGNRGTFRDLGEAMRAAA